MNEVRKAKILSVLPEKVLRAGTQRMHKKGTIDYSDGLGWTVYLDASYRKWCRKDKRKRKRKETLMHEMAVTISLMVEVVGEKISLWAERALDSRSVGRFLAGGFTAVLILVVISQMAM